MQNNWFDGSGKRSISYNYIAMPLLGKGSSLMERDTLELYLYMCRELKKRFPQIEGL